jgi:hypothetical protein
VFSLVAQHAAGGNATQTPSELPVALIASIVSLCKTGYGEQSFRFAMRAEDADSTGALTEHQLWAAIQRSANRPLDSITRNHLRRAVSHILNLNPFLSRPVILRVQWRAADKEEHGDDDANGAEAGESAPDTDNGNDDSNIDHPSSARAPQTREPKVLIDSYFEKVCACC